MKRINKILIANRGEIAVRIIRTCREMGISTVAVHSDADKNALFVKQADEGIVLNGNTPAESYLDHDKVIEATKRTGADAIHPGYGFLAENALFAKRCEKEGIIFIGPSAKAIELMGSKAASKALMKKADVPVVPGYEGKKQSVKKLSSEAEKIGFPILLKASAGGGGKGMRIVRRKADLKTSIETAKREAKAAFGDDRLIVEKYFENCRHIEFQIFGDSKGNVIHLGERECTIQRRHQKITEESPSPALSDNLRKEIGEAAIRTAQAISYTNAGTVEFILTDKKEFYFLEMNTRLQVEHPVTEMVTGLDLVKLQIEVAENEALPLTQEKCYETKKGYALECRLYAENPANNFLPETGAILKWQPAESKDVRYDSGIESGADVSAFYDPMLAKIIAHGEDRESTFRKMIFALRNTVCLGVKTNKEFLVYLLENKFVQEGKYNTHFIENKIKFNDSISEEAKQIAAITAMLHGWHKREKSRKILKKLPSGWRNNFYQYQSETYLFGEEETTIEYRNVGGSKFTIQHSISSDALSIELISCENCCLKFTINGLQKTAYIAEQDATRYIHLSDFGQLQLKLKPRFPDASAEETKGGYKAPMPGEIVKVLVKKGAKVKKGDGLLIINSMKMENTIEAHSNGIVEEIFVNGQSFVEADTLLLKIKE